MSERTRALMDELIAEAAGSPQSAAGDSVSSLNIDGIQSWPVQNDTSGIKDEVNAELELSQRLDRLSAQTVADREAEQRGIVDTLPELGQRVKEGALVGAVAGTPFGPAGALGGLAVGGAASGVGGLAEWATGSPVAGMATEFAADPLLGVGRSAVRAVKHLPKVGAYAKARNTLEEIGADAPRNPNAPGVVQEEVDRGYGLLRQDTDEAYRDWRATAPDAEIPSATVTHRLEGVNATEGGEFAGATPHPITQAKRAEEPFTSERLESMRRELVGLKNQAARSGNDAESRRLGKLIEQFEGFEDELADVAGDTTSRDLLKRARSARKRQGEVETGFGRRGKDTLVKKTLLDEGTAGDDPTLALSSILRSKGRPVQALRQMRAAASRAGGDSLDRLNGALRSGYLDLIMSRGGTMAGPTHKAPAAWRLLENTRAVGREVLGERRFLKLQKTLKAVAMEEGAGKVSTAMRVKGSNITPALIGALGLGGAGLQAGGMVGGGAAASIGALAAIGAGRVLGEVVRSFGEKAGRRIAIEALADDALLKKISRKAGAKEGKALAGRLMQSLVRRGVISVYDAERWSASDGSEQ